MLTTLHLVLGRRRPHELPAIYITRERMLLLRKALLAWLITGTPPKLWEIGCLSEDIVPPPSAHIGLYPQQSVAATIDCPNGEYWRPTYPAQTLVEAPNPAALIKQQNMARISQGDVAPPHQGPPPAFPQDPPLTKRVDRPCSMDGGKITMKPGAHSPT